MPAPQRKIPAEPDGPAPGVKRTGQALFPALRARSPTAQVRGSVTLAFPAADVEASDGATFVPAALGLLGTAGTLPYHYTERVAAGGAGARAFLDIFSARALALHDGAWRKHRHEAGLDDPAGDPWRAALLALAGAGHEADYGADSAGLARHAAAVGSRTVPANALAGVLAEQLGIPVSVEQFVGEWDWLRPEHRNGLGRANCALSGGAVLGERIWRRDLRIRIHLGPLDRQAFERFLPGGPGAAALRALLRRFGLEGIQCEARLHLRAGDVRPAQLRPAALGARLGFDSFLQPDGSARDDVAYVVDCK
jgi:type VI secretion system protein ImpH